MSSGSPSMPWRHLKKTFGSQPCVNLDASTWFHSGPLRSHVESAVTDTSALAFDWWEVCKARPRPFAVSQSCVSYHGESLVVVFTGSLANITLQVRPEEREHQAAASKVWLCFVLFLISVWNIQRLVQGAVRIANGYLVVLFLHGLARELAFD